MRNGVEFREVFYTPQREKLAILDAGAQYGKVIDRRVRSLGVESDILPLDTSADKLREYKALIISGGPKSVYDETAPRFDPAVFSLGKPILGICYGMQLLAHFTGGGKVHRGARREDGPCTVTVQPDSLLFHGLDSSQRVLMSHGDVVDVALGFRIIADSQGITAAIEDPQRRWYGVQFHPEVDLTAHGKEILRNFLFGISGFSGDYTIESREEKASAYIRERVGNRSVLVLVSGGVDSTVCAALLTKAIGPERIHAILIDTGFMRLGESAKVKTSLGQLGLHPTLIDASERFYSATTVINGVESSPLSQTMDPETKRKIIGDTFIRIAQEAIQRLGENPDGIVLAQGTLRPDLIESASQAASSAADTIKTHHNDSALARAFREQGRIVEPLQEYHKDEVRELGIKLGLPPDVVWRQPFPGPGLAIRIICAEGSFITEDFDKINKELQEFVPAGVAATLIPIKTVGVQGDARSYSYVAGLSGTKDWGTMLNVACEIPKKFHMVNRVVYIFGGAVYGPVKEVTTTHLTRDVKHQLELADDIVSQLLLKHGLLRTLSQVPVILFPVHFGVAGYRSIAIRTFITNDFMTGVPAVPGKDIPETVVEEMVNRILLEVPGISRVAYDLTSKPPGTTEWE